MDIKNRLISIKNKFASIRYKKIPTSIAVLIAVCLVTVAGATSGFLFVSNIVHLPGIPDKEPYTVTLTITDDAPTNTSATINLVAHVYNSSYPTAPDAAIGVPVQFWMSSDGKVTWVLLTPVSQLTDNNGGTSYVYILTNLQAYDFKATALGTPVAPYQSNIVHVSFATYHIVLSQTQDAVAPGSIDLKAIVSGPTALTNVNGLNVTFWISTTATPAWTNIGHSLTNVAGLAVLVYALPPANSYGYDFEATVISTIIIGT